MSQDAFVISDLHLGGGSSDAALEDFRQDKEFVTFIDKIAGHGTTLVINGDFIDFAQIPPYEVPPPFHLLWTEEASFKKLEAATLAHSECFDVLARFVRRGARIYIIIGNHDLDLIWENVQSYLRKRIGARSTDQLSFHNGHIIHEGVWIEHGHQFTAENCPRDPTAFVHTWNGVKYLERVWGTDFLLQFFNDVERNYPFADKVKPTLLLIYHGLRNRWIGAKELVRLLVFLKGRQLSWSEIKSLAKGVFKGVGIDNILNDICDPALQQAVTMRQIEDTNFNNAFAEAVAALSDEERTVLAQPLGVAAADGSDILIEEDGSKKGILGSREYDRARALLGSSGVTHVVFGHTHIVVNGGVEGHLFNPGTWIPRLNLRSPEVTAKIKRQGITKDMLSDLKLYVVDRLAVHIIPDRVHQARVRMVEVPSLDEWLLNK